MAMPTQLDTYVGRRFIPKVVDLVTTHDPLFERLWPKKVVQVGGQGARQPLRYGKNTNVGTYRPHGDFRKVVPETKSYCEMDWANYYVNVLLSNLEKLMAVGEDANLLTLVKDQLEDGTLALQSRIHSDIVGDGAAYTWPVGEAGETVNPIEGLEKVLTKDNTYGGINASTEMITDGVYLWNPYRKNGNDTTYAHLYDTSSAAYLPMLLRETFGEITDGADGPTIGIMPQHIWDALWRCTYDKSEALSMQKVALGKLGYTAIQFEKVPFIVNKNMPLDEVWVLNERYLTLRALSGAVMSWSGFNQQSGDTKMGQVLLSMALLCSNRQRQGAIYGLSDNRS